MRIGRVERFVCAEIELASRAVEFALGIDRQDGVPSRQRLVELERAILDPLGVESAIGAKVDVFEENAEHGWRDGSPRVGRINRDDCCTLLALNRTGNGYEDKGQECERVCGAHRIRQHSTRLSYHNERNRFWDSPFACWNAGNVASDEGFAGFSQSHLQPDA